MRQSERFWGGFACVWALAGCNGFDPASLFPPQSGSDEAGAAGYSYEPGPTGGRTATAPRPNGDGTGAAASLGVGGSTNAPADPDGSDGGSTSGAGHGSTAAPGRGGSSTSASSQGGRGGTGGRTASSGVVAGGASTSNGDAGESGQVGAPPVQLPRELFFSEYVEAGSDKALEIFALAATDLDGCVIATYANGATSARTHVQLAGPIEAGGVYTVCSAKVAAKVACNLTAGLSFNGNDAVALICDNATLDVIGEIGNDPMDGWSSSEAGAAGASGASSSRPEPESTAAQTLRRRCGIMAGDADGTDAFDPSVEWVGLPTDTLDGLGDPTCG